MERFAKQNDTTLMVPFVYLLNPNFPLLSASVWKVNVSLYPLIIHIGASINCYTGLLSRKKVLKSPLLVQMLFNKVQKKLLMSMNLCKEVGELAHSVLFKIILVTIIIISIVAIALEIWVMFKTTIHILVHQNTRILIITHQLWLIFHCIGRIFTHTYVLLAYQKTYADLCEYMTFPWECFMIRTPITLTLFLNAASIAAIVTERAIATYFSSKYEKFGRSVAVILVIVQLTIGIGSFLFLVSNFDLLGPEKVVYCSTGNAANAMKSAIVFGFYMTIDFISALIFPVLFCINKQFHRSKIHVNLSHRYQITENINSLQTLSPMVAFHSLCLAFYLGALFMYFVVDFKFSHKQFAIYLESVQQTPIYALTLPIALVWTEKYVRKTTQENRRKAIELKGHEAANHYF
uniref:Serpentine Receptor, class T n=1 Tax=Elaeophora elaphi TaxID=1147741 RepID=A0A0R3RKS1_9BILA